MILQREVEGDRECERQIQRKRDIEWVGQKQKKEIERERQSEIDSEARK